MGDSLAFLGSGQAQTVPVDFGPDGRALVRTPAGWRLVAAPAGVTVTACPARAQSAAQEIVTDVPDPMAAAAARNAAAARSAAAAGNAAAAGDAAAGGNAAAARDAAAARNKDRASLASTGQDIGAMVTVGAALVLAGVLLLIVRRRPREVPTVRREPDALVWVDSRKA